MRFIRLAAAALYHSLESRIAGQSQNTMLTTQRQTPFYSFNVRTIKKNTTTAMHPIATLFGDSQKLGKLAQV
jgi:hypothetical protein